MRATPSQSTRLRVLLFGFIGFIIVLEFPGSRDLIQSPYSGIETQNLTVKNIDPMGPNVDSPIRRGDEILTVEGERVRNYDHLRAIARRSAAGQSQQYTFRRGDRTVPASVDYIDIPPPFVYRRFAFLLVAATFLLMALLVIARRSDAIGLLFSLNCAILAFFLSDRPIASQAWLQLAGELFHDAVILAFPATFLHFFLVFHDRPHRLRPSMHRRRLLAIYALPVILYSAGCLFAIRHFFLLPRATAAVDAILIVSTVYMAGYVIASLIVFARNYKASSRAQKQKLRIAIAGTVAGILPFLTMTVWGQVAPGSGTPLEFAAVIALAFVSVSFAYAILKHGAIEINIVVRRSLAYALLTGVIIAGYYGLVRLLGDYLMRELRVGSTLFSLLGILVLAAVFAPARDRVQAIVDRLFFRGDYDYNHEIVEFNQQLPRKLTRREVLDYCYERMTTLLHASYITFYAQGPKPGEWAREDGPAAPSSLPHVFLRESLLGRYLTRYRKPLMVEYIDYAWGRRHLDGTSTAFLKATGAAVCLPVASSERVLGVMVLGPKRSGRLYTQTDSLLLDRFAQHLGLVLENVALHEATMEQARLKSEVMLARDIQLRLLPKASPRHPAVDIAGRMTSSEEVGGDYFDYFELDSDRLGLCIGDVNGHGVPAAMLMSSLQAVFKNLALKNKMNPADLLGELNRYLCANADADQFATFFYGILDVGESTFSFSNAGHCPALLVKADYVDRLGEGGLPLGVDEAQVYPEGRVRIEPGDTLCLYTDGITEQTDAFDQEFGEGRLIAFLREHQNLPLITRQELLFAQVLAHGGGVQRDDITCIIACYKTD